MTYLVFATDGIVEMEDIIDGIATSYLLPKDKLDHAVFSDEIFLDIDVNILTSDNKTLLAFIYIFGLGLQCVSFIKLPKKIVSDKEYISAFGENYRGSLVNVKRSKLKECVKFAQLIEILCYIPHSVTDVKRLINKKIKALKGKELVFFDEIVNESSDLLSSFIDKKIDLLSKEIEENCPTLTRDY